MKMTSGQDQNGDVYARLAHIPALVHNHLDSLHHRAGNGIILAASSLTGRYWSGSLWYFDKAENAPDVEKCSAGVELDTGVNDTVLITDNQILLGTDTGMVQVWDLNDAEGTLIQTSNTQAHDSVVTSVSKSADSKYAASGGMDKCIKVWDLEEMTASHSYKGHFDAVNSVACHPTQPEIFLSCGQDGRLLLWDTRKPKPASIVDCSVLKSNPTALAWQPERECAFAVGSESGAIALFDYGKGLAQSPIVQTHTRTVHRLVFSPKKPQWLASTSDDCLVAVSDFSTSPSIVWQSDVHCDFTRGVSWDLAAEADLTSCGWDFKVKTHTVKELSKVSVEDMDTLSPSPS